MPNTKQVLVVHPWAIRGSEGQTLRFFYFCTSLSLLSDASHAHGSPWRQKPLGHIVTFYAPHLGYKAAHWRRRTRFATTYDPVLASSNVCLYGHGNRVSQGFLRKIEHLPMHRHKYPPIWELQLALDRMESLTNDRCRAACFETRMTCFP